MRELRFYRNAKPLKKGSMIKEVLISFAGYRMMRADVAIDECDFRVGDPPQTISGYFLGMPLSLEQLPPKFQLRLIGFPANYDCDRVQAGIHNKFTLTRVD